MNSITRPTRFNRQQIRQISVSCCHWRRKPPPERDPTKRNFQGEQLELRLKRKEEDIEKQKPYLNAVASIVQRYKAEIEAEEKKKQDQQGEEMQRELAEREERLKNIILISKNNEELRQERELHNRLDQEERVRKTERRMLEKKRKLDELRERNKEIVRRVIEESKTFITVDNLDDKISEALDTEVNYNYAITTEGEKIHSTKPPGNLIDWDTPGPSAFFLSKMVHHPRLEMFRNVHEKPNKNEQSKSDVQPRSNQT